MVAAVGTIDGLAARVELRTPKSAFTVGKSGVVCVAAIFKAPRSPANGMPELEEEGEEEPPSNVELSRLKRVGKAPAVVEPVVVALETEPNSA